MRKILAIIFTIITIFAIKESIYIFTSIDQDIASKKTQLIIVALSITMPLFLLTIWLWIGKRDKDHK